MNIKTKLCNPNNMGGNRSMVQVDYIVIHYTSNRGDTAKNNADYFSRAQGRKASAHYFVDETEIWSSVPVSHTAYHCGAASYRHKECRNLNSIGIEICMNDANGGLRMGSIEHAVQLTRYLMAKYDIPIDHVLRHYDVTGKDCPAPMVSDTGLWTDFFAACKGDEIVKTYRYVTEMPAWAQDTFARLFKAGIVKADKDGCINVQESSLQPMVYLDRICGGEIEKLGEMMRKEMA